MLDVKIAYTTVLCSKIQTAFCDVWHDTSGKAETF